MLKDKKPIVINLSGVDRMREVNRILAAYPEKISRVQIAAVRRALLAVRTLARKIAKKAYTAPVEGMIRWRTDLSGIKHNEVSGVITFTGPVGRSITDFSPISPVPNWKGVLPADRKPAEGMSAQVRQGGSFRPRTGLAGEKSWYARMESGRLLVMYRVGNLQRGQIAAVIGPTPIQALSSRAVGRQLSERADEILTKRLEHEIQRTLEGNR